MKVLDTNKSMNTNLSHAGEGGHAPKNTQMTERRLNGHLGMLSSSSDSPLPRRIYAHSAEKHTVNCISQSSFYSEFAWSARHLLGILHEALNRGDERIQESVISTLKSEVFVERLRKLNSSESKADKSRSLNIFIIYNQKILDKLSPEQKREMSAFEESLNSCSGKYGEKVEEDVIEDAKKLYAGHEQAFRVPTKKIRIWNM